MKKLLFVTAMLAMIVPVFSAQNRAVYWESAQAMTDTAAAMAALDAGVAAFDTKTASAEALHDYTQAVNIKYYYLNSGTNDEKKAAYKKVITAYEKLPPEAAKTAAYNTDLALMWARTGDISDILESASNGMADKIKKYAETSLAIDPVYEEGEASVLLGRLYYKAPNIPFILTWPDKKVSKKYLEEALKISPDSLIAKFFLADTLWELDSKDAAKALYKEILDAKPRPEYYLKDMKVKDLCEKRMKELGI